MSIVVSAPDAFFDAEPWVFDLILKQPGTSGPMDLTGVRLYVAFKSVSDGAAVGVCDSASTDGSLIISEDTVGKASFKLPSAGRSWHLPARQPGGLLLSSTVIGDLYCLPLGVGATWGGIARISIDVLPSTGVPPA